MFTREEIIIVRDIEIFFDSKKDKVSIFQGLDYVNLFLATTCWIYKNHKLKIFRRVLNTGILTQLNYKLCRTDNNLTSLRRNFPCCKHSFYSIFLILNTETNY